MSVNVSAVQFKQRDLVEKVVEALEAAQLPPDRLELEITESLLLQGTSEALAMLSRLKGLGVKIAMDDFGTGYSSLSYLQKFPFDKIKIDRSFVAGMDQREGAGAIVRAIVQLGHSLGMQTCAEGVETVPQLELLRHEGCTEAQGYMFGRPTPASEIDRLLLAQTATARQPEVERPQRAAKPYRVVQASLREPVA
jgi:EAL domain-containing protein (putative c-di-GMP-specific phosphodiesterase class I)